MVDVGVDRAAPEDRRADARVDDTLLDLGPVEGLLLFEEEGITLTSGQERLDSGTKVTVLDRGCRRCCRRATDPG
jgi:hypothetical protein